MSFPTHHAMVCRIRASLRRASQSQQKRGKRWYNEAHDFAAGLADTQGWDIYRAAAVVAALSPRVAWETNLRDAHNVAWLGWEAETATYYANKAKAVAIAHQDACPDTLLGGPKVRAFWRCIAQPDFTDDVCVDTWACRGVGFSGWLTTHRYKKVARAYKAVADKVGLAPHQVQAIVWLEQRESVS